MVHLAGYFATPLSRVLGLLLEYIFVPNSVFAFFPASGLFFENFKYTFLFDSS